MFFCQLPAEILSELVNVFTEKGAVLFGEIDMLEYTVGRRYSARLNEETAVQPVFIQPNDFTRLNFTNEFCAHDIKGTRLTGNHVSTLVCLAYR